MIVDYMLHYGIVITFALDAAPGWTDHKGRWIYHHELPTIGYLSDTSNRYGNWNAKLFYATLYVNKEEDKMI